MEKLKLSDIKYKPMSSEDFLINLDRLTRFKHPSIKYKRVFKDILTKHLISPQIPLKKLEELNQDHIFLLIRTIWNGSIESTYSIRLNTLKSNIIKDFDKIYFSNIIDNVEFLPDDLILSPVLKNLPIDKKISKNIELLAELSESKDIINAASNTRRIKKTKYPIEKVVLAEGITEEILLPKFAKQIGYDFDEYGIEVIGAGGKTKIIPYYEKFKKIIKLPIVILLDYDALDEYEILKNNMNKKDKVIIIKNGEFEDIISKNLIKRALNNEFYDIEEVKITDLNTESSMCQNIRYIYKSRKLGEFQKAQFAKILASNVKYDTDISPEIIHIVNEIKAI